jgi:hypothetical protein
MPKFEDWTLRQWPRLLLHAGWVLFGIACLDSPRLPVEALFVGPGMMAAGVAMIERDKRESRGPRDLGAGDRNVNHRDETYAKIPRFRTLHPVKRDNHPSGGETRNWKRDGLDRSKYR